jgi:hypothetical protein
MSNDWEYCKINNQSSLNLEQETGICFHKVLFPMKEMEFWGMCFTVATLIITNMAGLGGGGTMVPVLQGFFKFDPKNAVAISNSSIFVVSVIRIVLNRN